MGTVRRVMSDVVGKQEQQRKELGKLPVIEIVRLYRKAKAETTQNRVRTIQREFETYELLKRSAIADIAVKDLTERDIIDNFITKLQATHSYSSAKKAYELLKATLKWAASRQQRIIPYNECADIVFPEANTFVYNQNKSGMVRFYTFAQQRAILDVCDEKYSTGKPVSKYGALIKLLLYTGLREGEACYLQWKNVDLVNRQIVVCGTVIEGVTTDEETGVKTPIAYPQDCTQTKSSMRTIQIFDGAFEALMELRNLFGDTGFVVKADNGEMFRPSYVRKKMESVVKRVAKKDDTILNVANRVYALRHTFACNMLLKLGYTSAILDDFKILAGYGLDSKTVMDLIDYDVELLLTDIIQIAESDTIVNIKTADNVVVYTGVCSKIPVDIIKGKHLLRVDVDNLGCMCFVLK